MAKFTVEMTHYVPVYSHITVECASPEDAPAAALALVESGAAHLGNCADAEGISAEFCTGIWEGDSAYYGRQHEVPADWCRDHRLANE